MFSKNILYWLGAVILLVGCTPKEEYPGVEYAPQMYHSVPYEPLTQFTEKEIPDNLFSWYYQDKTNSINVEGSILGNKNNSLIPVEGTVKRQNFTSVTKENMSKPGQELLLYNLGQDDYETAGKILKNPVPKTPEVLAEGQELYKSFCLHCHGEGGKGDGKVGVVYKGVANLLGGAYKNLPEGHIFHVITHGKGRMWAHKSQIDPEERWKIVHYVMQLQGR
ncbi:MAG: c-type cytochrome [Flammeovirgaceae bacterium]